TESTIGMLMALNGVLIAMFEMVVIHNIEGRRHNLQFIVVGTLLTALSFIAFNILPGAVLLAVGAMLIGTVGEVLSMPFMNSFWISRTSNNNRGQYAGLYTVAWSVAQVLGPSTGAVIAERWGFTTLWWYIGGV